LRPPIAGAVEFERVTFRYSESAPPALDDISLTIPAGSVFGIVGRSGSGKTTLRRLIRGMYPIQLGSVRVDGHDIRELDLPHLHSNVGVVMQQCFSFAARCAKTSLRPNPAPPSRRSSTPPRWPAPTSSSRT
jgi:ATP-binding cassette subfamily B protein